MTAAIHGADGDIIFGSVPAAQREGLVLAVEGRAGIVVNDAFPICESSGQIKSLHGNFRIRIPDVVDREEVTVDLWHRDMRIDQRKLVLAPMVNANGISALDMLALHKFPLAAPNGIVMQAGFLEMTGLALAPAGDPSKVSVLIDDDDSGFEFIYPLPSAGARPTYWYWPNADYCTFKIAIDLGAKGQSASPSYKIEFRFDSVDSEFCHEKNSFYVPKCMSAYESFPTLDRLQRVQRFENVNGVAVRGFSDCMRISALANKFGLRRERMRVLDWGCGHGRVIRHFRSVMDQVVTSGIDIDPDNIDWAKSNLSGTDFRVGPLMPPTDYPNAAFDLVYGISVMTHLTRDVQVAWLQEIRRILAPGGLALLTFAGDTSVAFASRFLDREWVANYRCRGVGVDLPSGDLVGVIDNPSYYKNVKVNAKGVADLCGQSFDVLGVLECMFGYQELAVLRRV